MRNIITYFGLVALSLVTWGSLFALSQNAYFESDGSEMRVFEDVTLDSDYGAIHFTVSRPEQVPQGGLPCIFIISGLETGRKSLKLIPDHGDYILVSYEYPSDIKKIKGRAGIFYLSQVRRATLSVPAQVNQVIDYLSAQSYVDTRPISMIGISFGSVFIPSIMHMRSSGSRPFGPIVLGYGGAGLKCLFRATIPGPDWFRSCAAKLAAVIFHPIEPALHFPFIQGNFLIVSGVKDRVIPLCCVKRLQEITPEPKMIVDLETDHLQPDNQELLIQMITISRTWLEAEIAKLPLESTPR